MSLDIPSWVTAGLGALAGAAAAAGVLREKVNRHERELAELKKETRETALAVARLEGKGEAE